MFGAFSTRQEQVPLNVPKLSASDTFLWVGGQYHDTYKNTAQGINYLFYKRPKPMRYTIAIDNLNPLYSYPHSYPQC